MILEHRGKSPQIHREAYVAPNATICGEVEIAPGARVGFGAVIVAQGGPVSIGRDCIIMENAVLRGSRRHPLRLGDHVLVGPQAHLTGCHIENDVFLATGCAIFNGARIGERSQVRIHGVVHVNTELPPDSVVPIGWVAVGRPAIIRPVSDHDEIWKVQQTLDFPGTVFGLPRAAKGETIMPQITRRYSKALARHRDDRQVDAAAIEERG